MSPYMNEERIYTEGWADYELIDAGGGKKLERWGDIITIRPEVQAYFKSELTFADWNQRAHFEFISKSAQSGEWKIVKKGTPTTWNISFKSIQFQLELTKFKHLGLFPEQRLNWDFISSHLNSENRFLNLFAYTGAASCIAKSTEAETIHVDSVKQLISWARTNQELSQLSDIKWVHEDALKFVEREIKRGNKYDGIIMDPPAWGIGAKGEKWKLEDKLETLVIGAKSVLTKNGFLILNTYSPTISLQDIQYLANKHFDKSKIEVKELWMKSTTGKDLYYGNLLRIG
jgi:23S rRNA (cytosine1962-C5)-methyltransferase